VTNVDQGVGMHNDDWHGISLVTQCSRPPHRNSSGEPWLRPWTAPGDCNWLDGNGGAPVKEPPVADVIDSVGGIGPGTI